MPDDRLPKCPSCGKGIIHVCSGRKGDRVTMGPTWLACGACGYQGPKADHPEACVLSAAIEGVKGVTTYSQTVTYEVTDRV